MALAQCGLEEEAQVALLEQGIKEAAEGALAAVLALEAGLSVEQRGGRQVHTDFLGEDGREARLGLGGLGTGVVGSSFRAFSPGPGVDLVLTVIGRTLTPVVLKLNSGLCLEACGALEGLWAVPRLRRSAEEAAAAPLVETMLRRSGRHLMDGKQLLVIGAGGVSKKFVWEAARDYGLTVGGARPRSCSDWWERAANGRDQFFRPEWPCPGGGSSWRGAGPGAVRGAPQKKQRKRRGGINRLRKTWNKEAGMSRGLAVF